MAEQAAPLYQWPEHARFGRTVPKGKFYEHGKVNTAVRDRFVAEVQRITWAYKLADTTVRLAGSPAVPEIQVFEVECKGSDVSDAVLTAVDRAVHTPIIFEVARGRADGQGEERRMVAAHKQLGGKAPKVGTYFGTPWVAPDARAPLPVAVDLPSLYAALLAPLLPVVATPGEDAATVAARVEHARKLQREIATLERSLRTEPQFNRKVELRRTLTGKQAMLAELTDPTM